MTHLKISNRSIERIIAQSPLFVEELASFSVGWRAEQSVIETFFQFLAVRTITWK